MLKTYLAAHISIIFVQTITKREFIFKSFYVSLSLAYLFNAEHKQSALGKIYIYKLTNNRSVFAIDIDVVYVRFIEKRKNNGERGSGHAREYFSV